MGQEIDSSHFKHKDFQRFHRCLQHETELLRQWFDEQRFADEGLIGGFELEAWIVDAQGRPAPVNERYLALAQQQALPVVSELASFNLELNSSPRPLQGNALSAMYDELDASWRRCDHVAQALDCRLMMIGILPQVTEAQLALCNMSQAKRYKALNEQVLRMRRGRPLQLDIAGRERLVTSHHDVMTEAATTSFQLHLQVPPDQAARYYNLARLVSAPMVALTANSPFLFGHDLWDETRIPLFEQSVAVGGEAGAARVTFGDAYAQSSLFECFQRNLDNYPVLLPSVMEEPPERLAHVRLHNGTIWRWNRPLIGFDTADRPHLRLEHRVVPAGPTVADAIANAAFFFGVMVGLQRYEPWDDSVDFATARRNFYAAARQGLDAQMTWRGLKTVGVSALLTDHLLPLARRGLVALDIDHADIDRFLGIVADRLRTGQNGTAWQRAYVAKHGGDLRALTLAYLDLQSRGTPVHEWII